MWRHGIVLYIVIMAFACFCPGSLKGERHSHSSDALRLHSGQDRGLLMPIVWQSVPLLTACQLTAIVLAPVRLDSMTSLSAVFIPASGKLVGVDEFAA